MSKLSPKPRPNFHESELIELGKSRLEENFAKIILHLYAIPKTNSVGSESA